MSHNIGRYSQALRSVKRAGAIHVRPCFSRSVVVLTMSSLTGNATAKGLIRLGRLSRVVIGEGNLWRPPGVGTAAALRDWARAVDPAPVLEAFYSATSLRIR